MTNVAFGEPVSWQPQVPRLGPFRGLLSRFVSAVALLVGGAVVPKVDIRDFWGAVLTAVIVAVVNAIVPPIIAALRLPLMVAIGFLLVLVVDAWALLIASDVSPS